MEVLPVIPKRFKFAKGATWLFLGLFILALAYTYYRAEIIFHGEFGEKYFNYYVMNFPRNSGHQESDEYNHFWRCANGRET